MLIDAGRAATQRAIEAETKAARLQDQVNAVLLDGASPCPAREAHVVASFRLHWRNCAKLGRDVHHGPESAKELLDDDSISHSEYVEQLEVFFTGTFGRHCGIHSLGDEQYCNITPTESRALARGGRSAHAGLPSNTTAHIPLADARASRKAFLLGAKASKDHISGLLDLLGDIAIYPTTSSDSKFKGSSRSPAATVNPESTEPAVVANSNIDVEARCSESAPFSGDQSDHVPWPPCGVTDDPRDLEVVAPQYSPLQESHGIARDSEILSVASPPFQLSDDPSSVSSSQALKVQVGCSTEQGPGCRARTRPLVEEKPDEEEEERSTEEGPGCRARTRPLVEEKPCEDCEIIGTQVSTSIMSSTFVAPETASCIIERLNTKLRAQCAVALAAQRNADEQLLACDVMATEVNAIQFEAGVLAPHADTP